MIRQVAMRLGVALMLPVWADQARSQNLRVGIIDFYGLRHVTESQAREALKIKEGDAIITDGDTKPDSVTQAEGRLSALPGVLSARINLVCCDGGRAILYVGIEEQGTSTLRFRAAPRGSIRLSGDVMQAGQEFFRALMQAVQSGDAGEDESKGHALMHDPTARAIQERFIVYAARDLKQLRDVLRHSADAEHRALAAQILGYAANKRAVIGDLAYGMDDPSESVRNNAMRALAVIAPLASGTPELKIRVPTRPFVRLLNSPVWTDRNKASMALMALSANRDPELIASLREHALDSLIEMARWKSEGHAAAIWLLGRISRLSEDAIQAAWSRGDREAVIDAALKQR